MLHGVIGLARSASSRSFQAGTRDRLTSCSRTLTRADLLSRQARFSQLVDRPIYPREAASSSLGEVPCNAHQSSVGVTWRSRSICPNSLSPWAAARLRMPARSRPRVPRSRRSRYFCGLRARDGNGCLGPLLVPPLLPPPPRASESTGAVASIPRIVRRLPSRCSQPSAPCSGCG